jgi:hypothetical protein
MTFLITGVYTPGLDVIISTFGRQTFHRAKVPTNSERVLHFVDVLTQAFGTFKVLSESRGHVN